MKLVLATVFTLFVMLIGAPSWAAQQPTIGTFTSGFGMRWGVMHHGIDIAGPIGTPIRAAMSGTVLNAGTAEGFGLWVRIHQDDGTVAVYGHVDTFTVHPGQRVSEGDTIATMGNRGDTTGPHLHFEVWSAPRENGGVSHDPMGWLNRQGVYPNWADWGTAQPDTGGGVHLVGIGETLSGIAQSYGMDWTTLHSDNADTVPNPNLIVPGMVLRIR